MPDNPTVEILDVTPAMAKNWLSRNSNNRNLRGQVIASYARSRSRKGTSFSRRKNDATSPTPSTANAPPSHQR